MTYPHIYEMLKANGHTPLKAMQIIIDARRGDDWAIGWIKFMFSTRNH